MSAEHLASDLRGHLAELKANQEDPATQLETRLWPFLDGLVEHVVTQEARLVAILAALDEDDADGAIPADLAELLANTLGQAQEIARNFAAAMPGEAPEAVKVRAFLEGFITQCQTCIERVDALDVLETDDGGDEPTTEEG